MMASVPSQITPAATTTNSGTDVIVSWNVPSSNNGATITKYRISFK